LSEKMVTKPDLTKPDKICGDKTIRLEILVTKPDTTK
jgi:hypothetical protein